MNRIIDFQKVNGLTPDGIIGKKTLLKIKEVFKISTDEQVCHFLGQCAVESVNFTVSSENTNYTKVQSIINTFKHDVDSNRNKIIDANELAKAQSLASNPIALANFVYANQNGNGNEASGDGSKFSGEGAIQLTGRKNFQLFADFIKDQSIMLTPELVGSKYFFESGLFFFTNNKLWSLCKKVDVPTITLISRRVNGGTNGLKERIEKTLNFYKIIKK